MMCKLSFVVTVDGSTYLYSSVGSRAWFKGLVQGRGVTLI